jgi:predicted metal-dependent peptidase
MSTPEEERDIQLEKTKLALMMRKDTMFYTTIMFSLIYKWTDDVSTAATDGRHMLFNPKFFDLLTQKHRMGVFVHEVLHVALNHITRGIKHDHVLSNQAADYVCNLIVIDAGFELPPNCLYDRKFEDMSYEQVYKILKKEQKDNPNQNPNTPCTGGTGGKGTPSDPIPGIGSDILPPMTEAEATEIEAEVAAMVLKATVQMQQAGSYGSIPGAILVELDKTLNPKLPWETIFQDYMNQFAKDDYSWRRPNKKYLPDLIMPSAYSEAICNIVFAVDTSGSVSDNEFGLFAQEIEVVQQALGPELITIIDFDTKIHEVHEVTQSVDVLNDIEFHGRGGTDVKEVLEWACENNPEVIVIFTDGDFRQPSADLYPDCPVLWLIHNNPDFTAECSEVIHYEL